MPLVKVRPIRVPHHFMNYKYKGKKKERKTHLVFDSLPVCSASLWITHQPLAGSAGSRKLTQFLLRRRLTVTVGLSLFSPPLLLLSSPAAPSCRRRCIIKTKSKDGRRHKAVFEVQVSVAAGTAKPESESLGTGTGPRSRESNLLGRRCKRNTF